jgi:DNA repair exonuclease SbcCD ATPase subunit
VKEEESGTLEVVQAIQSTSLTLQKAKDAYTQKGLEFDKLKKENASAKDLEKAESKLKKAQEDYKNLIDKYSAIKDDFEKKMSLACKVRGVIIYLQVTRHTLVL